MRENRVFELEKQLNDLRVTEKIARAALFDNIQALDARVAMLESQLEIVKDAFEQQMKLNDSVYKALLSLGVK